MQNTISLIYTPLFFQLITKTFKPDYIFDVGSMDGSQSIRLKKMSNLSNIIAFEANPDNYKEMLTNKLLLKNNIRIVHNAVWNENKEITFFLENKSKNKGISSIRQRNSGSEGSTEYIIDATRLDTFIKKENINNKKLMLWIDTESAGYEVLEGIQDVKEDVRFIHVEVETKQFWKNQKTQDDVISLMENMEFILIAKGKLIYNQRDLIFVNKNYYSEYRKEKRKIFFNYRIIRFVQKNGGVLYRKMVVKFLR